jgi:hypothetical protein
MDRKTRDGKSLCVANSSTQVAVCFPGNDTGSKQNQKGDQCFHAGWNEAGFIIIP